jgi:hypothetical protein
MHLRRKRNRSGVLSADGRANIVAALKKRWAAKKATVGAQPATASKKADRKKAD